MVVENNHTTIVVVVIVFLVIGAILWLFGPVIVTGLNDLFRALTKSGQNPFGCPLPFPQPCR